MSFKIAKRPVVGFPVSVSVYDVEGKAQRLEFIAQYKRAKHKELRELITAARNLDRQKHGLEPIPAEDGDKAAEWPYKSDLAFLEDRMCGWVGVKDEDGAIVEFSPVALNELLSEYPEFTQSLFDGFFQAHLGARTKN